MTLYNRSLCRKIVVCLLSACVLSTTALAADKELKKAADAKPVVKKARAAEVGELQRGEVLDTAYGDVDGDGQEEEIVLLGNKLVNNSKFMGDLYVVTKDSKTGRTKGYVRPVSCGGYSPYLTLAKVTGDGFPSVIITAVTGGSGGIVDYRILNFFKGQDKEIFTSEDNKGIGVSGSFLPNYRAEIKFPSLHKSVEVDVPGEKEMYQHLSIYNSDGSLKESGQRPYIQGLIGMVPIDADGDGVCEVYTTQRVVGAINADTIGYVRTAWQYYAGVWQPRNVDIRTCVMKKRSFCSVLDKKLKYDYDLLDKELQQDGNNVLYPHFSLPHNPKLAWKINSALEKYIASQLQAVQNRGSLELCYKVKYAGKNYLSLVYYGAGIISSKTTLIFKPFNFDLRTGEEVTLDKFIGEKDAFWKLIEAEAAKGQANLSRKEVRDFYCNGKEIVLINRKGHEFSLQQATAASFLKSNKLREAFLTNQSDAGIKKKKEKK